MVENDITRQDLAQRLDCQYETVRRYLSGERTPDTDTLIKLSQITGQTIDELLFGNESSITNHDGGLQ